MDLYAQFRQAILANELDNNLRAAYRFSDPDGVKTGKSGWSFGVCQFDINNNPSAILCLRECGFTTDEILTLKAQSAPIAPFSCKLAGATEIVDRWDILQLTDCLRTPLQLCKDSNITLADDEARIHLADYHNQFYMSRGGKMHLHLKRLGVPVTGELVRDFKFSLPWGLKRPDDVKRRYNNIAKLMRA